MKPGVRMIAILSAVFMITGCSMASIRQEWFGLSASDVMASKNKQTFTVNMSGPDCINKIKEALTAMKAIVREDVKKHYIYADNFQEVFRSTIDTTQAGIVVTWLEANKSQIDVASNNIDLAIFVAKELDKKLNPKQEIV